MLLVQAHVKHTGLVSSQSKHGDIVVASNVPDNAGVVRRASHHDLVVVLQAENTGVVEIGRNVIDVVSSLRAIE